MDTNTTKMALKKAKDLYRCVRNIDSISDGQARVVSWDSDKLSSVTIVLSPKEGVYKGGTFVFKVSTLMHNTFA